MANCTEIKNLYSILSCLYYFRSQTSFLLFLGISSERLLINHIFCPSYKKKKKKDFRVYRVYRTKYSEIAPLFSHVLTALFCFLYFIRVLLVRTLTQSQCKGGAWSLWKSGARPPQATPCGSRGWSHAALALGGSLQPQAALGERCPAAGFPKHLHNTKVADHLLLGRSFPQ